MADQNVPGAQVNGASQDARAQEDGSETQDEATTYEKTERKRVVVAGLGMVGMELLGMG